jgi:hypothetical protein
MTQNEHELMVMMFARMHEAIGALKETMKSRALWTADDEKAFSHAVHFDDVKLIQYSAQALKDYLHAAKLAKVETGLEK